MIGVYENRWWFSRYKPVLEILENGVVYKDRIYAWRDIETVGVQVIVFSDGAKCNVNPHTFRKKGDKARISFLGGNATFRAVQIYLTRKQMESHCDPRIDELESELNRLEDKLEGAGDNELIRIERKMAQVRTELFRLQDRHIMEIKSSISRGRKISWVYTVAALVLILVIIWLRIEKP